MIANHVVRGRCCAIPKARNVSHAVCLVPHASCSQRLKNLCCRYQAPQGISSLRRGTAPPRRKLQRLRMQIVTPRTGSKKLTASLNSNPWTFPSIPSLDADLIKPLFNRYPHKSDLPNLRSHQARLRVLPHVCLMIKPFSADRRLHSPQLPRILQPLLSQTTQRQHSSQNPAFWDPKEKVLVLRTIILTAHPELWRYGRI